VVSERFKIEALFGVNLSLEGFQRKSMKRSRDIDPRRHSVRLMGQHMTMQKPPPAVCKLTGDIPRLPRFQQRCIAVVTDRTVGPDLVKMLTM
jgi:hypothetical protein